MNMKSVSVGVNDCNDKKLFLGDTVSFQHEGKKLSGKLFYEGCIWIIVCKELEDGYIRLGDYQQNDGVYIWVDIEKS